MKLNSDFVREKNRVLDVQGELSQMFGAALQDATESPSDSDFIRVVIHSDSLIRVFRFQRKTLLLFFGFFLLLLYFFFFFLTPSRL